MINPIEGTFRTIIARKCYFNLWNILNGPDAKQNNLITGSPGIGKSMFLLFVMWKLKLDGKSFVYIHHKPKIFYLFHEDKVYFTKDTLGSFGVLSRPEVWLLADSIEPLVEKNRSLMVSYPALDKYKEYLKILYCGKYYMPIWSEEECLLLYETSFANQFSRKEFQKRLSVCGGIPRHIFGDYKTLYSRSFNAYCSMLAVDQLKFNFLDLESNVNEKFQQILVINVNEEDVIATEGIIKGEVQEAYTYPSVTFCSGIAVDLVVTRMEKNEKENFIKSVSDAMRANYNTLMYTPFGVVFEAYSLMILARGGSFFFRPNREQTINVWTFDQYEQTKFSSLNEINQPGFYVPANKIFALVDAILVLPNRVVGIQVTVNKNHPFALSGVKRLKEKFGSFDIVYVVPERMFDSYVVKTGLENIIDDPEDSVYHPSTSSSASNKRVASAKTQTTKNEKLKGDPTLLEDVKIYILKMAQNFSNVAAI